ncbi:MAG: MOSC domain-containing protein [Halofilum sp. (in: g-proteobacteria)]
MANGIAGDEQGDIRHHGGVEKAVHHYPADHYAYWCERQVHIDGREPGPGAFGENLVTHGLTEADVCIGDIYCLGQATVCVSQPRQPCWRLNVRFGDPDMARKVQQSQRTGWYYRVLEPGFIAPGDPLERIERPHPDWPLSRILEMFYDDPLNREALSDLLAVEALAESWRGLIGRRLEKNEVERWAPRLDTPAKA